jgi:titin
LNFTSGKRGILFDTQHPESLEKIRRLEEPSGYHIPEIPDKAKQIPKILSPLRPAAVDEGASAHFETRISPTDDVDMKVEWFVNGRPLQAGHRVKQINDFGFLALDILYTRLEDFGNVTVRVHNSLGVDETSTQLTQLGKLCPSPSPLYINCFSN